jgi:hypothetical protein
MEVMEEAGKSSPRFQYEMDLRPCKMRPKLGYRARRKSKG